MAQRTDWVDYGKGIGIILVVYAHLLSSGFHAGLQIQEHFFLLSDSIIYSFHMPLFFFLTGLFVEQSYTKRGAKAFLFNKAGSIAYPYLVWSFLQGSIELFFSQHSHRGITPGDIAGIPYLPLAQFWFLYALVLMYVAYALFAGLGRYGLTALAAVAVLLFFFPVNTGIMALQGFSTGFLFFVFGVLANRYLGNMEKHTVPIWGAVVLFPVFAGAAWFVFEKAVVPIRLTDGSHPLYFLFLATFGITLCVWLSQYLARKKCCVFVQILGRYSLQIYLVHMLAGVSTRIILVNFLQVQNPIVHIIAGVSAGLLVPILVYKTARKIHFPYLFEPVRVRTKPGL